MGSKVQLAYMEGQQRPKHSRGLVETQSLQIN